MIYDWYKIFNTAEFDALDVFSKTYFLNLEPIGLKEILVTKGNGVGILYEDVFLLLDLNQKNPFERDGFAIAISDTLDVYLGIQTSDN